MTWPVTLLIVPSISLVRHSLIGTLWVREAVAGMVLRLGDLPPAPNPLHSWGAPGPHGSVTGIVIVGVIVSIVASIIVVVSNRRTASLRKLIRAIQSMSDSLAREAAVHKEAERRLQFAAKIVENSPIVIAQYRLLGTPGNPGRLVPEYVSSNSTQFGYQAEDVLSGKIDFFRDIIGPQDRERVLSAIAEALRHGHVEAGEEYQIFTADRRLRWVRGEMRFERHQTDGALPISRS
jgi:hypothetical protein